MEEAAKMYDAAVEGGHAVAKNNLGNLYYHGKGVAQSFETAVDLFLSSSKEVCYITDTMYDIASI